MPVGVVLRKAPGATRWARWSWRAIGLLPGAGPGNWRMLRRDGEVEDFHAGTVPLTLYRTDTEAYLTALNGKPPSVFVVLRHPPADPAGRPEVLTVTASAYEAQDYADNGEDIVEPVEMPDGLRSWIGAFTDANHVEEAFVKRKRRPHFGDGSDAGMADPRVQRDTDVYRAPGSRRGTEE